MLIYASSPLSVSISGEWASILGEPQISLAIDKYVEIWVKKSSRSAPELQINGVKEDADYTNKLLGLVENLLIDYNVKNLSFTINIPLDLKYGLGCVSALCTALLVLISKIYNIPIDENIIIKHSRELEEKLLGYGSPTSSILALRGGVVAYREGEGYVIVKYKGDYNIVIGASNKAFIDVLRICRQYDKLSSLQSLIKHGIGHTTIEIADCLRRGNAKKLYEALNTSYMLQSSFFKIPPRINKLISSCRILGAYAATLSGINRQYVVCLTYKDNDRLKKLLSRNGLYILATSISKDGVKIYEY